MKKALLGLLFLFLGLQFASAQTVAYHENFEAPLGADSVTSSGIPAWFVDNQVPYEGAQYYRDSVPAPPLPNEVLFQTIPFSTTGQLFVTIGFAHIAKIEFFDRAYVEVSNDGGVSWIKLGGADYLGGSSNFAVSVDSGFNASSYPIWDPANNFVTPLPSWWQPESFDASTYLANIPNAMVRFRLIDGNSTGANGNFGWAVDSIVVTVAPCELVPPTITSLSGPSGNSYNSGPSTVTANITDASGIDSAYIVYTVNAGPTDTVLMTDLGAGNFSGQIPAPTLANDSICYYVVATDASNCNNLSRNPVAGDICYVFKTPESIPYFNNFDVSGDFIAGPTTGTTVWQLGTPGFGSTNSASSAPNAWDVNLTSAYGSNASCVVVSPPFNFTDVYGPTLSFNMNYNTEAGWDGTYIEYSTDSLTWTILGSVGDPNSTNWYTSAIQGGSLPCWNGNSTGWKNASIKFNDLDNEPVVYFRFVFDSDGIFAFDGFSFDDFRIDPPLAVDAELTAIINPGLSAIAGTDSVEVRVTNVGLEEIDTVSVFYSVNGGPTLSATFYDTLGPADFRDYKVDLFTITTGANDICAWIVAPGDLSTSNDSLCQNVTGVAGFDLPFFNDFDTGAVFTVNTPGAGSVWEHGTPTFPTGHAPFSAPNSWDIDLDAAYLNSSNTNLVTPWFKMNGVIDPIMRFNLFYITENFWDGLHVEYTLDGQNWLVLGVQNDPNGTNWYPTANINSSGTPGWAGTGPGWIPVEYTMPFLTGTSAVRFRFVFTSDGSVTSQTVTIDDFHIFPKPDFELSMIDVLSPIAAPCGNSNAELVTVRFENKGAQPVTNVPMAYTAPSLGTIQDTLFATVNPGDTVTFTFAQTLDLSTSGISYNLKIYNAYEPDSLDQNDTLYYLAENPVLLAPKVENFDLFTLGTPGGNLAGWSQPTNDNMDWTVHSGTTGSFGTGPSGDHTTGFGNYIYTEASGPGGRIAYFESPCMDLSGNASIKISFWYHMFGNNTGTLNFDVKDGSGNWTTIWTEAGNKGDIWNNAIVDLSAYVGQIVQVRFHVVTGVTSSDIAIDDVFIFEPQPYDVGISEVVNPLQTPDCGLSTSEAVIVDVYNFGINPIDSIPIAYSLDGGPMVWDTVYGPINPPDTLQFTFAQTIDLSIPNGLYNLMVHTAHPLDTGYTVNDTIYVNDIYNQLELAPFFENFDTFALGNPGGLLHGWSQDLENDDMNWTVHSGGTSSGSTGPSADHTLGTTAGRYMYTETSGFNLRTANLLSPCFDLSTVPCPKAEFWYHMYGAAMGSLSLDVIDSAGNVDTIWTMSGDQGDEWFKADVGIASYAGQRVKFRFRGNTGTSFTSDMAIDDFLVTDSPPLDVGIEALVSPNGVAAIGTDINPIVRIKNLGCEVIPSVNISYTINGGLPITETYSNPMIADEVVTYTFNSIYSIPNNDFVICVYIAVAGDTLQYNDTVCSNVKVVPGVPVTHCSDFDVNTNGWIPDTSSNVWQHGVPNGMNIVAPHSPPNVWMTGLGPTPYGTNLNAALYSPYFDFRGAVKPTFGMWMWLKTEDADDGLRVEYSTTGGNSWIILGADVNNPDPDAIAWYNDANVNSSGKPGWTNDSFSWLYVEHPVRDLEGFYGVVQFRLVFTTDNGGQAFDGVAVDDICVSTPPTQSLKADDLYTIGSGLIFPGNNTVEAIVENNGFNPINDFIIELDIDNGAFTQIDTVVLATPLVYGDIYVHTFTDPWVASIADHPACFKLNRPNGSLDSQPFDDSLCVVFQVLDTASADDYCNDFEGSEIRWVTRDAFTQREGHTKWELGTPAQVQISDAHSGDNAWMTDLDANYGPRDSSGLYSPLFSIDTSKCYEMTFWHNFQTELTQDGGAIHYSQDGGYTWHNFGYAYEPTWYNTNWVVGMPGFPYNPAWSGMSNGWINPRHLAKFDDPSPVIFRFRFGSDMTVHREGWAIDDFCLTEYNGICFIGVDEPLEWGISEAIPNPTSTTTNFNISMANDEKIQVIIFNNMGQSIRSYDLSLARGETSHAVDVSNLADGFYHINFQMNDGTSVNRSFSVSK